MARAEHLVILDAVVLERYSEPLLREVGRHVWKREGWPQSAMNADHWRRFAAVCRGTMPAVDFPDGISARRLPRVVRIGPGA